MGDSQNNELRGKDERDIPTTPEKIDEEKKTLDNSLREEVIQDKEVSPEVQEKAPNEESTEIPKENEEKKDTEESKGDTNGEVIEEDKEQGDDEGNKEETKPSIDEEEEKKESESDNKENSVSNEDKVSQGDIQTDKGGQSVPDDINPSKDQEINKTSGEDNKAPEASKDDDPHVEVHEGSGEELEGESQSIPAENSEEDHEKDSNLQEDSESNKLDPSYSGLIKIRDQLDKYIAYAAKNFNGYLYDVTYTVEKSPNAYCNVPNELILDNAGYYYRFDGTNSKINGTETNVVLNVPGSLITLNALDSDQKIEFKLSRETSFDKPVNLNPEAIDDCINTQYGFKLSEVIYNLTKIENVELDTFGKDTKGSHITLTQRAFLAREKRQIIFNFYFKNTGFENARNVLFKDILPKGVTLNLNGVYVNSCLCSSDNVNVDGQKILVKMPVIDRMGTATLTLICTISDDHPCGQVNVGVVSYVSKFVTSVQQSTKANNYNPIHINQCMSNAKSIDEVMKGYVIPNERFQC